MKKFFVYLLSLSMMLTCLVGCGAGESEPAGENKPETSTPAPAGESGLPETYDLVMTMGAETSSTYAMGIQIGEYINSLAPDITCTVKAGAGASNLALLNNNEAVIGHSNSDTAHQAMVGGGDFAEPLTNFYGVASVMQSVLHVVVPADCPVNTFKELVDAQYPIKLSVGVQGSSIESLIRSIFAYYGVSYEDVASWGGKIEYLNIGDASTLFTDGQLNGVAVIAGLPYATCSEIAASKDIKFLALDDEIVEAFSSEGYIPQSIPANTYTGQTEAVSSVAALVTVFASEQADENVIYEICKFLNSEDGIEILGNVNSGFAAYMTGPESGIAGIEAELHPGAARYYAEVGVNQ